MKKLIFSATLVISLGLAGCDENATKEDKPVNESPKQETIVSATKEKVATKLTAEKFRQIIEGMTYEEVIKIVGSKGKMISEIGTAGEPNHTILYDFETDGSLTAVNMMFKGGKLIKKTPMGMSSSNVKITMEQFNKLENDMSEAQVFEILGGEGDLITKSGDLKMYTYAGKTSYTSASITFQSGKLKNKTQMRLE
ncbi:hypothetical protein ACQKOF_13530 [Lysinibacillus sp. NPDC093190]|uniref:hypothetical protein n=1 Tax=Lysinibacillus sp. NPDC093190 TaxID=3390575 RepID=UPI003D0287B4